MIQNLFLLLTFIQFTQQQQIEEDEEDDDDDCAFISGQHCDQNGICKYCAMCLQSSCILSKTIQPPQQQQQPTTCNATQFGTTNLYNWYDYCLSSDNDSSGDYCATSTECYQYRKSVGPSVSYAWHNLTCNPSTCMLIASNGLPPPVPIPPLQPNLPFDNNSNNKSGISSNNLPHHHDENNHDKQQQHPFHNPAAIALTIVCSLVILVLLIWIVKLCKKKGYFFKKDTTRGLQITNSITSSIPSSAPPSFSSTPPDMAIVRHPHVPVSNRSSTGSSSEPLPSYLSPYTLPPKYEQAIVTQIRGLTHDNSTSSSSLINNNDGYHSSHTAPLPSMWVPVYFTQQQANFRRGVNGGELFGFTPNHSYWLQQIAPNQHVQSPPPPQDQQQEQQQQQQQQQ